MTTPRSAVARILGDGKKQRTHGFAELQSHYLFRDRFGRPGKANDKGKVEGLVGYARRNFLVPLPVFDSFEALNAYHAAECCRRRMADRLRGYDDTIAERLEPRSCRVPEAPAASLRRLREGRNTVSLRCRWFTTGSTTTRQSRRRTVHRDVLVRGYVHDVVISCGAEVIARHPRSTTSATTSYSIRYTTWR